MIEKYLRVYLLFVILLTCHFSKAQHTITIKFIGNCGLFFTDGETNIYADFPYKSGAYGYMNYEPSELDSVKNNSYFIFTHKHADHYSGKIFRNILKKKNGRKFTQWNTKKLIKLFESIPNLEIRVFKTKHRFALKHYSYLITWHGKKIFLSGDTENAETIAHINDIDWAFVPPWILDDTKEKNLQLDAKMIGVYHLYPSEIESALEEWGGVNNVLPLIKQGEIITIE